MIWLRSTNLKKNGQKFQIGTKLSLQFWRNFDIYRETRSSSDARVKEEPRREDRGGEPRREERSDSHRERR